MDGRTVQRADEIVRTVKSSLWLTLADPENESVEIERQRKVMRLIRLTGARVLITGGAGFIGSHLSARLLATGARVTILTRHTQAPRAVHLAQQGATLIPCDLSSPALIPAPDKLPAADIFFHLAADVSVGSSQLKATNVDGTQRALDLAAALKIPYFVFTSSIEAQGLGSDQDIPLREEQPCRPASDYGVSKAQAEDLVATWGNASDRQALTLRVGNIYGPGSAWFLQPSLMALLGVMPLGHVWPNLQHRVFQPLYIEDLTEGILRAASQRLTGLYNLTGEEPVTVSGYLHMLASLTGMLDRLALIQAPISGAERQAQPIAPEFAYFLMGTPERCHRSYDNTKLRSVIGAYARWSLSRGLASTLRWYHSCGTLPALLHAIRQQQGDPACESR
jgi:nucleoside-diphosphate-sugar epimerase